MAEQEELLPCPFESEHHFIHETTLPRMVRCQLHTAWLSPEQWNEQSLHARVLELERRLKIPFGKLPCAQCGGPHSFDTSVDSEMWNRVIRARGLPEYLCTTCIVQEFAKAGESFSAKLWSEEFNGTPITVTVNPQSQPAEDERVKEIARRFAMLPFWGHIEPYVHHLRGKDLLRELILHDVPYLLSRLSIQPAASTPTKGRGWVDDYRRSKQPPMNAPSVCPDCEHEIRFSDNEAGICEKEIAIGVRCGCHCTFVDTTAASTEAQDEKE